MPGQDWPGFHLQPTTYTHVPQKNKYWYNHVGAMPLKMAIFLSTHFKSDFVISASAFESWLSVSLVLCFHHRAKNKTLTLLVEFWKYSLGVTICITCRKAFSQLHFYVNITSLEKDMLNR